MFQLSSPRSLAVEAWSNSKVAAQGMGAVWGATEISDAVDDGLFRADSWCDEARFMGVASGVCGNSRASTSIINGGEKYSPRAWRVPVTGVKGCPPAYCQLTSSYKQARLLVIYQLGRFSWASALWQARSRVSGRLPSWPGSQAEAPPMRTCLPARPAKFCRSWTSVEHAEASHCSASSRLEATPSGSLNRASLIDVYVRVPDESVPASALLAIYAVHFRVLC